MHERNSLPTQQQRSSEFFVPHNPEPIQAALDTLEQGLENILDSGTFRNYLESMSKFHDYSYNNVMLIMAQKPDAERVAGFNTWKQLGRNVKKGEHGIRILAPLLHKVPDQDEPGKYRQQLVGYKTVSVFDVKQTDGKPLPDRPHAWNLQGDSDNAKYLYRNLSTYAIEDGARSVTRQAFRHLDGANGFYTPATKDIVVSDHLGGVHAAKTLAHESAHHTARHTMAENQKDVETVAESAAFVTLHHFGLDTSSYSFPYLASWAKDKDTFKRNLAAIQKTSHTMIQGIERVIGTPPATEITLYQPPVREQPN
jgi:antirestriction protein ArdC